MATWEPKYDFAVPEKEWGRELRGDAGLRDVVGEEWVQSPPSSHTEAFLLIDNRKPRHDTLEFSEVRVRFKAKGPQPAKEYVYWFPESHGGADEAAAVFAALCAAASPWKEVGIPRLEKAGVPYHRLS